MSLSEIDIDTIKIRCKHRGPSRVITNCGIGILFHKYAGSLTIIFVREDGWTLGAAECNELLAEKQWADKWIGYFRLPSWEFFPYLR